MPSSNKIYRSDKDYIIAGVCGGLAKHFEVDPAIIRLIFIILSFGGGSGILIYLVLWLILPKESGKESASFSKENLKEFADEVSDKAKEISKEVRNSQSSERGSFLGVIILLVGLVALINQIQPAIIRWDIFWPTILIATGLYLIFRKK